MRQRTGEILTQASSNLVGKGRGVSSLRAKRLIAVGQAERFKDYLTAARVRADKSELAKVGHQHQPVPAPIARDLLAHAGRIHVLAGRLHFHNTALGRLALARLALLHLLRRI